MITLNIDFLIFGYLTKFNSYNYILRINYLTNIIRKISYRLWICDCWNTKQKEANSWPHIQIEYAYINTVKQREREREHSNEQSFKATTDENHYHQVWRSLWTNENRYTIFFFRTMWRPLFYQKKKTKRTSEEIHTCGLSQSGFALSIVSCSHYYAHYVKWRVNGACVGINKFFCSLKF